MRHIRILTIPLMALAVQACATAGAGGGPAGGGRDLITADELEHAAGITNAYEAVERLRPNFLRSRGPQSFREPSVPPIIVYLDQVRLGEVDSLRGIAIESIRQIRHIPARDAQQRFGLDHTGGVIQVITMQGDR